MGWIPGQGTKIPHAWGNQAHVPQLPSLRATAKISRAATKAQGSQIKNQQKTSHSHPLSVQMKWKMADSASQMCWMEVTWLERARAELHLMPLGSPGCGSCSAVPAWNCGQQAGPGTGRQRGRRGRPALRGRAAGSGDLKGSTLCSLPAFLQAISASLPMCRVRTAVMITWETAGRALGRGPINCNYFKVLSTFNDWQEFGLCHQIFKYVFSLQLGTWVLG